jgi:hypothetical protein
MEACGGAWDLMCIKFFTESTRIAQGDDGAQPEFYRFAGSPTMTRDSPDPFGSAAISSPEFSGSGGGCMGARTQRSESRRETSSPSWLWASTAPGQSGRTADRSQGIQDLRLRDLDTVDWGQIVEKCAVVLKDHGDLMHIKDIDMNAAVKAMDAKDLLKCVGLEVEELTLGLLLRFIEQRGHAIDKVHLPGGQAQIRALWRDGDAEAPLVYLHCEGARLDGFAGILLKEEVHEEEQEEFAQEEDGFGELKNIVPQRKMKEPTSPSQRLTLQRQDQRVRTTQGSLIYKHRMPHELLLQEREKQDLVTGDQQEVNSSFHSLLPDWRSKLEDHKGFTQRRSALQERWKGWGKEFSDL